MIVTTYTCDKCGHKQTTKDQMWGIAVVMTHGGPVPLHGYSIPNDPPQAKGLWCRKCIEGIGLLCAKPDPEDKTAPTSPTLEDMIREVVDNAVHDAIQNVGD